MSIRASTLTVRVPTTARTGAALGSELWLGIEPGSGASGSSLALHSRALVAGSEVVSRVASLKEIPRLAGTEGGPRDFGAKTGPGVSLGSTRAAIQGEIRRDQQQFALGSGLAGAPLGLDSLRGLAKSANFGSVSDSRAAKSAATALAVFNQGCINERMAAAEDAVAVSECTGHQATSMFGSLGPASRGHHDQRRHA